MAKRPQDDLFEGSKMTFGEHLDELRVCLLRAAVGLVLGVVVGLLVANWVVELIKSPLERNLEKYRMSAALAELGEERGELLDVNSATAKFIQKYQVVPKRITLDKSHLQALTKAATTNFKEQDLAFDSVPDIYTPVEIQVWEPVNIRATALSATEVFMIWLQAGVVAGVVFSSPWVFWQIWSFVAAGLYPHERSYVYIFLPISLGLFLAGAALAFFFVFDPVLEFLFSFNQALKIDPDPRISEWMSFVLMLPIGFGVAFQLPLVMLFIERIGIIQVETYLMHWRISVLVIFVISMLLTPADPISMLLMAVPLTFLYFGGVAMCYYIPRSRSPFGEAYDP